MSFRSFLPLFLSLALCVMAQQDAPLSASALRPGDVLSVTVFRQTELSRTVRVEEDGSFAYPLCGEVHAVGLTPRQVAKELEKLLTNQIADPQVDVFVQTWCHRTVYVLGEVANSMSLELPTYGRMTALQAISAAGGFTELADLNHVAVLRRGGENRDKLVRLPIDVTALASQTSGGDDFLLEPEDTLIVPKAPPVYVAGMVGKPGVYNIDTQRPPLCSEMIIRAGGLVNGADQGHIQVMRVNQKNEQELHIVSIKRMKTGLCEKDLRIESGDYVFVTTAAKIYVLGQVNKPGELDLRPDQVVTASQAIALAGGFKVTAKQSDVILIRDGALERLNLKRLYEDQDNLGNDMDLRPGDILFIRESMW